MGSKTQDIEWESIIGWLFIIGIVLIGTYLYDDFHKNTSDKYYFEDGNAIFVEAKCPLGSIVHKDVLMLTNDNITIASNSFFGSNITTYPYNILKEIVFAKSFFCYKLVIKYAGHYWGTDKASFYFNQKSTFNALYSQFLIKSNNSCVISESY